jgi:hypothetical protein
MSGMRSARSRGGKDRPVAVLAVLTVLARIRGSGHAATESTDFFATGTLRRSMLRVPAFSKLALIARSSFPPGRLRGHLLAQGSIPVNDTLWPWVRGRTLQARFGRAAQLNLEVARISVAYRARHGARTHYRHACSAALAEPAHLLPEDEALFRLRAFPLGGSHNDLLLWSVMHQKTAPIGMLDGFLKVRSISIGSSVLPFHRTASSTACLVPFSALRPTVPLQYYEK